MTSFLQANYGRVNNSGGNRLHLYNASNDPAYSLTAYTQEDVLIGIALQASGVFDLPIKRIFEVLGEPQYWGFLYTAGFPEMFAPDDMGELFLFYPETGYIFDIFLSEFRIEGKDLVFCVKDDNRPREITIVEPGTIEEVGVRADYPITSGEANPERQDFYAGLTPHVWPGFTCITRPSLSNPYPIGQWESP